MSHNFETDDCYVIFSNYQYSIWADPETESYWISDLDGYELEKFGNFKDLELAKKAITKQNFLIVNNNVIDVTYDEIDNKNIFATITEAYKEIKKRRAEELTD